MGGNTEDRARDAVDGHNHGIGAGAIKASRGCGGGDGQWVAALAGACTMSQSMHDNMIPNDTRK